MESTESVDKCEVSAIEVGLRGVDLGHFGSFRHSFQVAGGVGWVDGCKSNSPKGRPPIGSNSKRVNPLTSACA